MMNVQNVSFEIAVNQLAAMMLNARNLTAEISEIIFNYKEEKGVN